MFNNSSFRGPRVAQWVRSLDLTTHTSLSPIRRGFAPGFVNYKKGALDSQPHVIKFTSCLPMVGGSLTWQLFLEHHDQHHLNLHNFLNWKKIDWLIDCLCFNATFSNIMTTSFSGGGSRGEPPTMGKQLVNFITWGCESSAPFL
jgi:hypothetical protein